MIEWRDVTEERQRFFKSWEYIFEADICGWIISLDYCSRPQGSEVRIVFPWESVYLENAVTTVEAAKDAAEEMLRQKCISVLNEME